MRSHVGVGLHAAGAAIVLALVGCPKELPPDLSPDELYRAGIDFYERGKYRQAIEALQRFQFQDPGHVKADSAQYLIGDSYSQQNQHITAAAEFLRLAQNRPAGSLADDSRYRACESYYELSPRPELDQEFTQQAIDQCRSVGLLYPNSPYVSEANARIQELTDKLALKTYQTAQFYLKRNAYDSAIVYLEHLLETFPGATVEAEAMLALYRSYIRVGYVQEADDIKQRLLRDHRDSEQARELETTSGESA